MSQCLETAWAQRSGRATAQVGLGLFVPKGLTELESSGVCSKDGVRGWEETALSCLMLGVGGELADIRSSLCSKIHCHPAPVAGHVIS